MTQKLSQVRRPWELSGEVLPLVAMLAAIVALSLAAIFIKLSERELGPFATIFNRFWVAYIVLWVWHEWNALRTPADHAVEDIDYTRRDQALLVVAALMFWGCIALWAWSLTRTEVANSTLLHNLTPLFTTLGGWLLLHQQFDRRFLLGLLVAITGAGALGLGDLQISASHLTGDIASLLSAVFSAANLMIIERLRAKFSVNVILQWCCFWGAIWTLPVVLLTEDRLFPISASGWISVICLALICQVLGQGLQAFSLKRLSSGLVGILLLLDPVLAALTAWVLFAESLTLFKWTAFLVVLLGVYLAKSSDAATHTVEESS
ncbi:DMT family transporter [Acaryochloris sp. IP29b_bin.137]|uniref:DMT family transporter n=1 Tax=Acaryochloris sp. IP29b_bin.137 TaxID=2969217 RepID=UPI00261853B2|nr:DMT family transporter [Acaryochloris sp. IP29b_bin.137]